ncbi:MAG: cohesin domain-containing protein, partial [Alphaproteobacteria bacterium]|nr:cohesin domain-containing protein [Alphaproteobacteria bacterium]
MTNPSVASIDAAGLLTGTQLGFTKVVAQDNDGIRGTTSQIEIRAMRLSIASDLSHLQGTDIDVPVNTTDLSGLNIYSGSFAISFDQNILTPVGVVQTGTLLASWPVPELNLSTPGNFSLAFAGSAPLTGSGTLIYIKFHVSSQNTGATGINFASGLFNEDLLPTFTNGYFNTINLPALSISPSTGYLVAGETQQLTVNGGGIQPFTWSVNNTVAVSIDQSGLMTAKKSGVVKVTVDDSSGATANSGNFQIYDTSISMPDTVTCPESRIFYYPILIKSLPSGESVSSIQATLNYDATYLTFLDIESTGTLTQGWTYSQNPSVGQIIFACSGTSSFNSAGTIL